MSTTAVAPLVVDLATLTPEALLSVKSQLRPEIEDTVRSEMRTTFELEIVKFKDDLNRQNAEVVKHSVDKWEAEEAKKREPLKPEQIQLMLDKEYATFKLKLEKDGEMIEFTLRELPQFYEKKFFKLVKDTLKDAVAEMGGAQFKLVDGDVLTQITSLMDVFEPALDVMAQGCVICLNPRGTLTWLDVAWIKENLSSERIYSILLAQVEVNRLRPRF